MCILCMLLSLLTFDALLPWDRNAVVHKMADVDAYGINLLICATMHFIAAIYLVTAVLFLDSYKFVSPIARKQVTPTA